MARDPLARIAEAFVFVLTAALAVALLAVLLSQGGDQRCEENDFAYADGYGDALSDMANDSAGPPYDILPTSAPTPTPTPEPTPKPTPVSELAAAPVVTTEKGALIALVNAAFPDDARMGGHVVWNESLKFPDGEWQDYVYDGKMSATGDCGLMQTNWYWHAEKYAAHGWGLDDCFDPAKNLVIAREIYEGAGCSAWTTC